MFVFGYSVKALSFSLPFSLLSTHFLWCLPVTSRTLGEIVTGLPTPPKQLLEAAPAGKDPGPRGQKNFHGAPHGESLESSRDVVRLGVPHCEPR